jgi:hypothetical protein
MFNHKYSLPSFIFIPLFISFLYTQNNYDVKGDIDRKQPIDSVSKKYYKKFDSALIVSLNQNYRDIEFNFKPSNNSLDIRYKAQSKLLTGITLAYDKFAISFNTGAANREGSANTKDIFNLQLDIGDLRKTLNIYFRSYKGFEDISTQTHDSARHAIYGTYKYPEFTFLQLGIQRLRYTNFKKYAYKSPYGINYRQLKPRGTWIWGWNVISTSFDTNTDSVIFPYHIRDSFGVYKKLKGMNTLQAAIIGGAAYNLVIKKFFIDATLLFAPELQFRSDNLKDSTIGATKLSFNALFKMSIGFNGDKFYFYVFSSSSVNYYHNTPISIYQYTNMGGIALGTRFTRMKVPKFYKKFKQTKVYKYL